MNITCIAVDDEPLALELMETYILQVPGLHLLRTFTDAVSAWSFIQKNPVDLLFLDIQMPDISGLQMAKSLEKRKPLVIFTTAFSKYAVEGFNVHAVDYLLKPFEFNRFKEAVDKAVEIKALSEKSPVQTEEKAVFVKSDYQNVRIPTKDIHFIEGFDDYIRIHVDTGKSIYTLMSLKSMLEKLPENEFIRVHRSYIVPINRIQRVFNQQIQLGNKDIPIGKSYIDTVRKRLQIK
jgi:two-component system, LytTR family, response regulator